MENKSCKTCRKYHGDESVCFDSFYTDGSKCDGYRPDYETIQSQLSSAQETIIKMYELLERFTCNIDPKGNEELIEEADAILEQNHEIYIKYLKRLKEE